MKHISIYVSIILLGLLIFSCKTDFGEVIDYTDYQVENKLDAPVSLLFKDDDRGFPDFFVTIPSHSYKTIIFSANGYEGYSPNRLKSVIVSYKDYILVDSVADKNSILNSDAYAVLAASTYKKEVRHNLRFTIDSMYIKEHLK